MQNETLEVVRSLVDDGLFRLGDVHLQRFFTWKRPLDRSMHKISHHYVDHYDNPKRWMYSAWLKLTDKGEQLAQSLEDRAMDYYRELGAGQALSAVSVASQLRTGVAETDNRIGRSPSPQPSTACRNRPACSSVPKPGANSPAV